MSETSIASKLKEHPYRIKLALNNAYKSTINELVSELNKLFYLDYKIKTGEVDRYKGLEAFFIEYTQFYLLVCIFSLNEHYKIQLTK